MSDFDPVVECAAPIAPDYPDQQFGLLAALEASFVRPWDLVPDASTPKCRYLLP